MQPNKLLSGLLILVLSLLFATPPPIMADCSNSQISSFNVTPSGTVDQGTWLAVSGSGNCGTARLLVNGIYKAEEGQPNLNTTIKTEEFPAGQLVLVFQLRDDNDGGWQNATSRTITVTVRAVNNPTRTTAGVNNWREYCISKGYDRATFQQNNAFGWKCVDGNRETGLDMYDVCDWLYDGELPYPGLPNANRPYSWTCNREPAEIDAFEGSPPRDDTGGNTNNPPPSTNAGGNSGGSNTTNSTSSIPYTNARVGDQVVVVNSPSNAALLCKSSAERGTHDVIGRVFNGATMTIVAGPWESGGLYFVQVTGECNGYVATGVQGERWIQRTSSSSSGSSNSSSNNSGGSSNNSGSGNSVTCNAVPPVSVGSRGRVKFDPPIPNRLRSNPNGNQIGTIQPGQQFDVIGGPRCIGQYRWWQVRLDNGTTGWTADGDTTEYWIEYVGTVSNSGSGGSGGSNPSSNNAVVQATVYYSPLRTTYELELNQRTCAIVNGAEIVAQEINRFNSSNYNLLQAVNYFAVNSGGSEGLRHEMEDEALSSVPNCSSVYYLVGNLYMDTSGLGNILFGYYVNSLPIAIDDFIASIDQAANENSRGQLWDNPDDESQRRLGRYLASNYSGIINEAQVIYSAEQVDLQ